MLTKFRQLSWMILRFPGIVKPPLILPGQPNQSPKRSSRHRVCATPLGMKCAAFLFCEFCTNH